MTRRIHFKECEQVAVCYPYLKRSVSQLSSSLLQANNWMIVAFELRGKTNAQWSGSRFRTNFETATDSNIRSQNMETNSATFFLFAKFIAILVIFTVFILLVLIMTLVERRMLAFIQGRLGPNRVGIGGILQPVADGLKSLLKEKINPVE